MKIILFQKRKIYTQASKEKAKKILPRDEYVDWIEGKGITRKKKKKKEK